MPPLPALMTVAELYPPKPPEDVDRLRRGIVAFKSDGVRSPELRRALTVDERHALEARKSVVDRWTERGSPNRMKLEINELFTGFGGPELDAEAQDHRNANYAFACRDLPLWAIARACLRFRQGNVRPEEVGEKTLSTTWRPSSAQLCRVANKIAQDLLAESAEIAGILNASAPSALPAPAARSVEGLVGAVARHLDMRQAEKTLETARRQIETEDERAAREAKAWDSIEREYRRAGLSPPLRRPGDVPISLALRLSLGAEIIEDEHGNRILISVSETNQRRRASSGDA